MTLQQQIRQEIADSLQRVREEMHTAISCRVGAISSISSAMQRLSAGLAETAKPHRISDLIPKSWDGSHEKGQFRNFMAELRLWMQAWSDQGERILVRVERRQGVGQQVQGQKGFEAWHLIGRRYDQRNTSDLTSAKAALISNISERDLAKDVEQLNDILRNFIKETNKFEGRFGKIRDEENTLVVKRLMPRVC